MRQYSKFNYLISAALSLAMLIIGHLTVRAQEETEVVDTPQKKQTFRFVYVAPDRAVDKKTLEADINTIRDNANQDKSPVIFYLANGKKPIIVELNTDENNDSSAYSSKLIYYINNNTSWTVDISDRQQIRELLLQKGIIDDQGNLTYGRTELYFYVGKEFWVGSKNETIIGALYFDINAAKYKGNDALFQYNVYFYCPPGQDNIDRDKPFGNLNPDGINEEVKVRRRQSL